ncbi:MAG: signal peptidase I [Candidatus Thorarchaeota archaeon]
MEKVRQKLRWNDRSEWAKTAFLLAVVIGGTLTGYGIFMVVMGTTSPLVVVTSESMETTLYRGDLLVLQARAQEDIHLLDIVVYQDTVWHTDGPIVHRVVEIQIVNGTYYYYTKGDNNAMRDPGERTYDEIVGVVVGRIPAVGNVSLFLRTPEGFAIIIILFIVILVVPEFVCAKDEEEQVPTQETTVKDIDGSADSTG